MNHHPINSKLYYLFEKIKYSDINKEYYVIDKNGLNLHRCVKLICVHHLIKEYIEEYLKLNPDKINIQDHNGNSLIMKALSSKESAKKLIKILLKYKPDLNLKNNDGNTALRKLMYKKSLKHRKDILKLFLDHGININERDVNGETILFYSFNIYDFKTLLKYNADVNIQNDCGETVLFQYVKYEFIDLVKLFMKHNPYIDPRANFDQNVIVMSILKYNSSLNKNSIDFILPTRKIYIHNVSITISMFKCEFWNDKNGDFKIVRVSCSNFKDLLKFL